MATKFNWYGFRQNHICVYIVTFLSSLYRNTPGYCVGENTIQTMRMWSIWYYWYPESVASKVLYCDKEFHWIFMDIEYQFTQHKHLVACLKFKSQCNKLILDLRLLKFITDLLLNGLQFDSTAYQHWSFESIAVHFHWITNDNYLLGWFSSFPFIFRRINTKYLACIEWMRHSV